MNKNKILKILNENPFDIRNLGIFYINNMMNVTQNSYHDYDVYDHTCFAIKLLNENIIGGQKDDKLNLVKIALLFHDIGKPLVRAINKKTGEFCFHKHPKISNDIFIELCDYLLKDFSKSDIEFISKLILNHEHNYDGKWSNKAIKKYIKKVGIENIKYMRILCKFDNYAKSKSKRNMLIKNTEQFFDKIENLIKIEDKKNEK